MVFFKIQIKAILFLKLIFKIIIFQMKENIERNLYSGVTTSSFLASKTCRLLLWPCVKSKETQLYAQINKCI